jgi:hypothetical protein
MKLASCTRQALLVPGYGNYYWKSLWGCFLSCDVFIMGKLCVVILLPLPLF